MSRTDLVSTSRGLLPILLLTWMSASVATGAADTGQAEVERLKQRVNGYFSTVHSRKFTQAREFILPSSRDAFNPSPSGKTWISNFRIFKVKLEDGQRSAVVTIKRTVSGGGMSHMNVTEKFRWKQKDGEWFMDPTDPPKTDAEIFREYYYGKLGRALTAEFDKTIYDFGKIVQGDAVQPRFSFLNQSSQDLLVERIHGPDRLITDRTETRLVPGGSAGEIIVDLDTSKLYRDFAQDFFVQFEPVKEMVKLRITGKVYTAEEGVESPSLAGEAAKTPPATPNR